jgi:hypothetical protein
MKKDFLLFAGLALAGAGVYFWIKKNPQPSGSITTTGSARTDPNILTAFAQLFGKSNASTIASGRGSESSAGISAAVGPLAQLAGKALDKIFGAGRSGASTNNNANSDSWQIQARAGSYDPLPISAYQEADTYARNDRMDQAGAARLNDGIADAFAGATNESPYANDPQWWYSE